MELEQHLETTAKAHDQMLHRRVDLLLRTGKVLVESLADTNRIMRNMKRTAAYLGIPEEKLHINVSFTMLMVNVSDENYSFTKFQRINGHGVNMSAISEISKLSWRAIENDYTLDQYEEELEKIRNRQEKLRTKGGTRIPVLTQEDTTEEDETQDEAGADSENGGMVPELEQEYEVTANSALSEYLAVNMMNASPVISLADFPESSDQSYLQDAWEEAVYQNPMILGVTNASICGNGKMLAVTYDTEADAIREKQEEIAAETERVVSEIITDDMSELEKEIAINQYLCDTAEYDTAALENAGENDFEDVDDEFNDSFTPYGVLLNKTGVCSSYAGAFKLLAEEAGLECIVVTGYLDGELPHAWNKVKIDGEWQIVDSTNNDNELIFNALLNLPDTAADKVLVEDERYVLDSKLDSYQANTDEKEYYHINNRFYEQDQITAPLTEELKEEGTALLRTDYTLSDEQFMSIAQQAADRYGTDELGGCYWMGVIYLTDEY